MLQLEAKYWNKKRLFCTSKRLKENINAKQQTVKGWTVERTRRQPLTNRKYKYKEQTKISKKMAALSYFELNLKWQMIHLGTCVWKLERTKAKAKNIPPLLVNLRIQEACDATYIKKNEPAQKQE